MVGPWIFFDHMGPAAFAPGNVINVRPHPHINLATVTYLFEGEILHRDSLGSLQAQDSPIMEFSMAVFNDTPNLEVVAQTESRIAIIGGDNLGQCSGNNRNPKAQRAA